MRTHLMHMHKAVFQELDPEDAVEESAHNALTTTLRKVRHTGGNILVATKLACAEVGIGTYREETGDGEEEEDNNVDTVSDNVMNTVSDSASNMVSGWDEFNGYECCCHMLALSVLLFTRDGDVGKTFKNLRGMSNHFSHSILGCNLLHECQLAQGTPQTKPPRDNDTRTGWKGARNVAKWYHTQQTAVQWYDVQQPLQAATACKNPDGQVNPEAVCDVAPVGLGN
ncbi:hypothetical protein CYMTET_52240 [Cymbomonas tetramitiformis]|uniref:Uncharacterized protein n=1 Tax=Cymbomonas tetramitiformis TaxID=36881 RepID=A0AAE0BJE6_9CHLO|nr:hypothetical protein CYMTET_52240 [Cymbomonas tetramitiformis]